MGEQKGASRSIKEIEIHKRLIHTDTHKANRVLATAIKENQ